jgi:hypothetical protein
MNNEYQLTETVRRRIKQQIFRIMKNKLKGKQSEQLKTIYRMIRIAEDIYRRFRIYPYRIKEKHMRWWIDEVAFWMVPESREYRYQLAIKKFCQCVESTHWVDLLGI